MATTNSAARRPWVTSTNPIIRSTHFQNRPTGRAPDLLDRVARL
jgi:hypothetical protein